jgi:hypothetical protein
MLRDFSFRLLLSGHKTQRRRMFDAPAPFTGFEMGLGTRGFASRGAATGTAHRIDPGRVAAIVFAQAWVIRMPMDLGGSAAMGAIFRILGIILLLGLGAGNFGNAPQNHQILPCQLPRSAIS